MKISIEKLYNICLKIKLKPVAAFVYKINKLIVNILYTLTTYEEIGVDKDSDVIVSLTSFPGRINYVWLTISTVLNQTIKPKSVILWLSMEQFPTGENMLPHKLLELKKRGLTIRFCDNLYPHKKYYYTMQENPELYVITVDDDVFYPETLIENLLNTSKQYPNTVCCTWGHKIEFTDDGNIASYREWKKGVNDCRKPSLLLVPVGCGGVLYPPHILSEELYNKDAIQNLCLKTDDLWLKFMAIKNHNPAVRIDKEAKIYFTNLRTQSTGLYYENTENNKNDIALDNILSAYPEIYRVLYDSCVRSDALHSLSKD